MKKSPQFFTAYAAKVLPKSDQEKGSQNASTAPVARAAADNVILPSKPSIAEMSLAPFPLISGTFSMVSPSVQEKYSEQCQGAAAPSVDQSRGDIAPLVDPD